RDVSAPEARRRAGLVHGADAHVVLAGRGPAVEPRLVPARRHPWVALPRAGPERPLCLPWGNGARCRPGSRQRRGVHGRHRRRQPGDGLRSGPAGPRLRGADGLPVPVPRHPGVRRRRPGRTRGSVGRSTRQASLEHAIAHPVQPGQGRSVLVTGAGGQLGRALVEAFAGDGIVALGHGDWDVSLPPPQGLGPFDVVLHAAAWTDVDGAEGDPQRAAAVNVGGTTHARLLGPLVYFSSDYVFDGAKRSPYVESDGLNPLSAYGRSKAYGEAAAGEEAWLVRSSWLFGATGHNFVRTMLRLGAERDEVSVVDDQVGCPTYVGHLAEATREVLELPSGIWHVAADGECTWAEFA